MRRAKAEPKEIEPFDAFAARMERDAQPLAVVQVSHPDAVDGGLYLGVYAGIRLVKGEPGAVLSDGSIIEGKS